MSKVLILLVILSAVTLVVYIYTKGSKDETSFANPNFLLAGQFTNGTENYPALIMVNPNDFSVNKIDLEEVGISGTLGLHEARPFMNGSIYHTALATYLDGKFIILRSKSPTFTDVSIDFEEAFDPRERVRSVFTEDVNGDGKTDVVIGTRPSGIIKYYEYKNKKWVGNEIDRVGAAIHDINVLDSDGNGTKEIIATTSTTHEYQEKGLQEKIPEIIKYEFIEGKWAKAVIWKPENPIFENGIYIHPRYIFTGKPDESGVPEIISGVIGNPALHGLLTLKWNGTEYIPNFQDIGKQVKLNTGVISYGDIDKDGVGEILIPTLTGETLLLYRWNGNEWKRETLTEDLKNDNGDKEQIVAVTPLDSEVNGQKRIFLVAAPSGYEPGGIPKFYTLEYDQSEKSWNIKLVNSPDLPATYLWGIFPMSSWKTPKFDK